MTKQVFTALAVFGAALAFNTGVPAASAPETRLHQLQKQVNETTQTTQQWEVAMHTISVQTGVSRKQLRAMRQKHPTVEPSAVLISCVLADETKKAPEQFLERAIATQDWIPIARNHKVPLEKINERLERIQQAIAAGATARPPGNAGAKP
jgi:hypothetical protein